jgi:hypothetical protein
MRNNDSAMAIRKEWTEWHLTPRGWERGASRVHGQGNTWVEEPTDRVLSAVYQELQSDDSPEIKRWAEETWRSKKAQNTDDLLKQFGPAPEKL